MCVVGAGELSFKEVCAALEAQGTQVRHQDSVDANSHCLCACTHFCSQDYALVLSRATGPSSLGVACHFAYVLAGTCAHTKVDVKEIQDLMHKIDTDGNGCIDFTVRPTVQL